MTNDASLLAALAIVSTCVLALVWVIKHLFTSIIPALDGLNKVTELNTKATKMADAYLRERNGRDIEFHTELMASMNAIPEQIKDTAKITAKELVKIQANLPAQNIENQHVDKQVVAST